MLKRFVITAIFVLAVIVSSAQVLDLHVINKNRKPLGYAIVRYGTLVQSCDEQGFFRIKNYKPGDSLRIKKLGYFDTTLALNSGGGKDTLPAFVMLQSKVILLDEVPVFSNRAQEINPAGSGFIVDYELYGNEVAELLSEDHLLIINNQNQIKHAKSGFKGAENLVKDINGNLNLISSSRAFRMIAGNSGERIDTGYVNLENLTWTLKYCDGILDTLIFVRRYKDINQTVGFFAISTLHNRQFRLLKEITDADKKRAVRAHAGLTNRLIFMTRDPDNPGGVMGELDAGGIELRRKAERLVSDQKALYDAPSYNVMRLLNDSICIFAHDVDSLLVYDKNCHLARSSYIDYHHLKTWGGEIIVNEEKTKAYGKFISNKNIMIAEINLSDGHLKLPFFKIESGHRPKKIEIRGSRIYYLGRQPDGVGFTVYSQDLNL